MVFTYDKEQAEGLVRACDVVEMGATLLGNSQIYLVYRVALLLIALESAYRSPSSKSPKWLG